MAKVLKAKRIIVNPGVRRSASSLRKSASNKKPLAAKRATPKAKNNLGSAIVGLSLAGLNPGKKKKGISVVKKTKKKSPAKAKKNLSFAKVLQMGGKPKRKAPKKNPMPVKAKRKFKKNPGVLKANNVVTSSLYVIGGAVGSRTITQMILGAKNVGLVGYAVNAGVALGLGFGVGKFMKDNNAGTMVMLGGFTGLMLRVLQDFTPLGQFVNLQLAGIGRRGDLGVGMYEPTTFYVPLDTYPPGGVNTAKMSAPAQVNQIAAAAAAQAVAARPAAAAPSMAGVYNSGSAGRYTQRGRYN